AATVLAADSLIDSHVGPLVEWSFTAATVDLVSVDGGFGNSFTGGTYVALGGVCRSAIRLGSSTHDNVVAGNNFGEVSLYDVGDIDDQGSNNATTFGASAATGDNFGF